MEHGFYYKPLNLCSLRGAKTGGHIQRPIRRQHLHGQRRQQASGLGFKELGFEGLGFKGLGFKELGFEGLGFKGLGFKSLTV